MLLVMSVSYEVAFSTVQAPLACFDAGVAFNAVTSIGYLAQFKGRI